MSQKIKRNRIIHAIKRTLISLIILSAVAMIIKIAPNYEKDYLSDRINLIINNNNITSSLKKDIVIKNDEVYLSFDDIKNFFDEYIIIENEKIITTSNTKTASISINENKIYENGVYNNLSYEIPKIDDKYYLPISTFSQIYNIDVKYNEKDGIVTIDSLNRKCVTAVASKNISVKYKPTKFSKNMDKIKRGETIIIIQNTEKNEDEKVDNWLKVRTSRGKIGYIKENSIINEKAIRQDLEMEKIDGKVSIVWDYYNQGTPAPNRTENIKGINVVAPSFFELKSNGSLAVNIGTSGNNYINWAKQNNLEIWPVLSNSTLNNIDSVSKILSSYEERAKLIDNIINELIKINVDGIHVDFEDMNKSDKDNYSRFIIELAPRLRDIGMRLSVLLTAPDGSDTWSLCYDRNTIGKVADYVVFMGYDQTVGSSKTAGTVSGADWVELNINKFLGQEGIDKDKIILAMPFYTRLWSEKEGQIIGSKVVNMKDVSIPEDAEKKWDEKLKQNYIEYARDNIKYKMWIEDEESIKYKIDLVNRYNLAGAGFWEKDREKEDIWEIVEEKLKNN